MRGVRGVRGGSWRGRTVWVTGASSGIGEALARELAARGARLVLSARRAEVLEAVRVSLPAPPAAGTGQDGGSGRAGAASRGHLVVPLDLGRPESLAAVAEETLARLGAVDVMVHNAGISQRSLAAETDLAVDRRLVEVNYLGTVALTKALLPSMLERGAGRFVVVTSLVGKIATPLRSSYSAAKHALHGFFESLRAEVYDSGVRVTLVCPGFVRTEVSHHALTADGSEQGILDRAQAEGMDPAECARRIAAAVEAGKDEVLVGGKERFAVLLHRLSPALFRRLIRRARVT